MPVHISLEQQLIQVKAAKLADLKAFWAEFYGASHAEVAVVADFDEAMIKKPIGQAIWQLE